jgi:acyl-CoA synthetase (AMP-forming)/AMP-acid ligase II
MPATDTEAGRIEPTSLADLLRVRAASQPQDRAYVLLSDRGGEVAAISFADLDRRAAVLARRLAGSAAAGDRALLLFPMGIDCLVAFFGCLYAGIIAVPMMLPRRQSRRDASSAIVADCGPRLALSTTDVLGGARGNLRSKGWSGSRSILSRTIPVWIAFCRTSRGAATSLFCNTPRVRPRPPRG